MSNERLEVAFATGLTLCMLATRTRNGVYAQADLTSLTSIELIIAALDFAFDWLHSVQPPATSSSSIPSAWPVPARIVSISLASEVSRSDVLSRQNTPQAHCHSSSSYSLRILLSSRWPPCSSQTWPGPS